MPKLSVVRPLWEDVRDCHVLDITISATDPPHVKDESISKVCGTSVNISLRKGRKHYRERSWEQRVRKQRQHQNQRRRRSCLLHGTGADIPCGLWITHARTDGYSWRNCCLWRTHTRVEEKHEEEGIAERNHYWL